MKITIVTGPFLSLPPASCGAIEKIWHDLENEFTKMGNSVTFLCRSHYSQKAYENIEGMTFIRKTSFKRSSSIYLDLLKDFIYSLVMYLYLPKADSLVTNTFWLPILASIVNRNSGAVVVNVARMPKGQIKLYSKVDRLSAGSTAVHDSIIAEFPWDKVD